MSFELCDNSSSATSLSSNSRAFDFDGLEESLVDNELNESIDESDIDCDVVDDHNNRDTNCVYHLGQQFHAIREALIRDAVNRTEDDLQTIQTFLTIISQQNRHKNRQKLNNNNNSVLLTRDFQTRRLLAKHFVLAEIESRDTRVLTNGERLDAYCVVACGSLRHVIHNCCDETTKTRYLCVGDEFGATLDDRVVFGEIFTNEDFVWVLCVPHLIFDEICGNFEKTFKTIRNEFSGKIIEIKNSKNELIRVTRDRLFELLLNNSQSEEGENDEIFISDFLLTFRLWASRESRDVRQQEDGDECCHELMAKIISNLKQEKNIEKQIKIVLQWISNHFQDFQQKNKQLLKDFEINLKSKIHKKLFYLSLSSKSREREITITRSERTASLPFTLIGGYECSTRLFISDVNDDCDADLSRGDRLISINGIDCHVMEVSRALDLCKSCTHLSLILKFDPNLYQLLIDGQISRNSETKRNLSSNDLKSTTTPSMKTTAGHQLLSTQSLTSTLVTTNNNWKQKMRQIVQNVTTNNHKSFASNNHFNNNNAVVVNTTATSPTTTTPQMTSETPEVIKIYYDSDFRYLPIHVTTTARECIQLALIEFQLNTNYSSRDFALYEYKLLDKTTATSAVKRLSDNFQNLAKNLSLNSRIYLKCISGSAASIQSLNETEITKEITRESHVNSLLTLDGDAIARELTARDFELFCRIESQQFVYDLISYEKNSFLTKELKEFEEKTNLEMFWTINQILLEKKSQQKRVKIIKQLIRIALICKELKNFNTLFAILSGLSHLSISRLKNLWEKIPQKSLKLLENLQQLMDPSKNFYNFRQKLRQLLPPIIPFFPLVKKDLSFIYLANQTFIEFNDNESENELQTNNEMILMINWEKMKLLSQKIREIQLMTQMTASSTTTSIDSLTANSYKKIWEKQRMKKRVQHFLDSSFLEIISDENLLFMRSVECEPMTPSSSTQQMSRSSMSASSVASSQQSNASSNTSSAQHLNNNNNNVMPSPTPSSHSSSPSLSSSTTNSSDIQSVSSQQQRLRLRFGVRDDTGLRKLLALSDNCVNTTNNHNNHTHVPNVLSSFGVSAHNHLLPSFAHQNRVSVVTNTTSQSLPQESSSVTSLRRLEQLQQLSRFRDQLIPCQRLSRPLLPSYDQTIQRMRKKSLNKTKNIEENIV